MDVGTPRIIVVRGIWKSRDPKNRFCRKAWGVEFAGAFTEASRYNKRLLPDTGPKLFKLFASAVLFYPSSNFSLWKDRAEKRLIGYQCACNFMNLGCSYATNSKIICSHGERFFSILFWQLVPIFGELSPFNVLLSNKGNILLHVAVYLSSCDWLLKTLSLLLYVTLHSDVNTNHAHAPSYLMWFLVQFDGSTEFQSNFNLQLSFV